MLTVIYAALFGILSYFILMKYIRYGFGRELILNLFCILQGRKYKWVREPHLARRLLSASSSKGNGIEQILSTKAFRPIVSLESVNDDQWSRMKDNFIKLKTHLPPLESLGNITERLTKKCLDEEPGIIDCQALSKLIVQIMQTWLFNVEDEEISPKLIAAIEEWRKEIAIKGQGDEKLKLFAINWIQDKIRAHEKYYGIFQDEWSSDEYWSLFLQPFIVSPAINITDVAVTLTSPEFKEELKNLLQLKNDDELWKKSDMEKIILYGISYNHPFPVLERWFPAGLKHDVGDGEEWIIEPNTHVFLPMDQIGRSCCTIANSSSITNSNWPAFGAGKRACGGREIALILCTKMFHCLLSNTKGLEKFKPWINHNYSGRNNDLKETYSQTIFQIKLLAQILWKLITYQKV